MALIDYLKAQQFGQQLASKRATAPVSSQSTEYQGRDPNTGDRLLKSADGSIVLARWTGETEPPRYPQNLRPGSLIQPGTFDA